MAVFLQFSKNIAYNLKTTENILTEFYVIMYFSSVRRVKLDVFDLDLDFDLEK